MSFFDDASLVMIPSGYKASKVYSVKPTDGTGDLTFTRSLDTATRVGPDGLIEKVRTNANINFQGWNKIDGSEVLTSGVVDPFGGTNAFNLSGLVAGNYDYGLVVGTTISVGANSNFTISLFAKGTGTIGITAQGAGFFTLLPITLTSTYTRHTLTISTSSSISSFTFYVSNFTGSTATAADIAFPQAETGDIATTYIPTTTAAVSVGMLANVPRLDYLGGGCPKLLLEPQRTNLVTFSEQLNNAAWTKTSATITANNAVSPAGFLEADTLTDVADNSGHLAVQSITIATSAIVTISAYLKKNVTKFAGFRLFVPTNGVDVGRFSIVVDLDTGVITSTLTSGETIANLSFSVVDAGNGWYRARISGTSPVGSASLMTWLATTGTPVNDGFATQTYVGNGQSVHVWGCQAELGSFATSYIPTLAAAVTRSADAASKTGISALIGQTEGTLFAEITTTDDITTISPISISDGSAVNRIILFVGSGVITARVSVGAVTQAQIVSPSISANTRFKIAIGYKANDFAFYVNGIQIGVDTSGSVPACSIFGYDNGSGTALFNGLNSQTLLFKTRLTNAQLEELTA